MSRAVHSHGDEYVDYTCAKNSGETVARRSVSCEVSTAQMPRPVVFPEANLAARSKDRGDFRSYVSTVPPLRGDIPLHSVSSRSEHPRGALALRWIARILCLGLLVFGAMTIYYLTEQSVADTSSLSSSADSLAEYGAYLVQSGQLPAFEDDPIKWTAAHILLLSVKFSAHGLSVRQQAHVVEFALLGGVIALNVLAWMSGWAHRRSRFGRIRVWRTWLMYALSLLVCALCSYADQYHKLYVPGRHFDNLDLILDALGYISSVTCVFVVWSIGSALYRLLWGK